MNLIIVAVHDTAANFFGRPQFVASKGVAIRMFADEVNRQSTDNAFNLHPDHFSLYSLGLYDDSSGIISPFPRPELLISGLQCKLEPVSVSVTE